MISPSKANFNPYKLSKMITKYLILNSMHIYVSISIHYYHVGFVARATELNLVSKKHHSSQV